MSSSVGSATMQRLSDPAPGRSWLQVLQDKACAPITQLSLSLPRLRRKGHKEENHNPDCDEGGKKAIRVCINPGTGTGHHPPPVSKHQPH